MWYLLSAAGEVVVYGSYQDCFSFSLQGQLIVHHDELDHVAIF